MTVEHIFVFCDDPSHAEVAVVNFDRRDGRWFSRGTSRSQRVGQRIQTRVGEGFQFQIREVPPCRKCRRPTVVARSDGERALQSVLDQVAGAGVARISLADLAAILSGSGPK